MPQSIRVRAIQAMLGVLYLGLAAIALARSPSFLAASLAAGMILAGYASGRTIPDFDIRPDALLRVCGVGLIVVVAGIVVDLAGGAQALGWASVVLPYCAGNRLRAAGIGSAA